MRLIICLKLLAIIFILLHPSSLLGDEIGNRLSVGDSKTEVKADSQPSQQDDVILGAMKEELERSMKKLSLKDYESPYFISYLIKDTREIYAAAKYGAIFSFQDAKSRPGYIEVRVGSHEVDNSRGLERDYDYDRPPSSWLLDFDFPVDDSPSAIRNRLWVLTDLLYKRGVADYLKKKGKLAFKAEKKIKVNDFSLEEAHRFAAPPSELVFDKEYWFEVLRNASNIFLKYPELVDSSIELRANKETKYLVNSEGTSIVEPGTYYALTASARAWSEDGMLLSHEKTYSCRDHSELPNKARLEADIERMISELQTLREADEIKPCTVPAIFDPEMTYVFLHEAVGHRLEGDRQREEEEGHTFKDKVGQKVLPEFLTLVDNPSLSEFEGKTLFGHYHYDDEGIPGKEVVLAEDGILKNYLMSRRPIENFATSNGHGRLSIDPDNYYCRWFGASPMGRMANLIVKSKEQLSKEEMERKLMEECRKRGLEFGLIFEGALGGHTSTERYDYQAFLGEPKLVYRLNVADGSRQLVRGVNIVGTPLNTLEKIVATGDDYKIFNGYCGAESGNIPVSGIVPSIFLSGIEIQKTTEEKERPPILPPPEFDEEIQTEKDAGPSTTNG